VGDIALLPFVEPTILVVVGGIVLKLIISTEDGNVLGCCEVPDSQPWKGLLSYAAVRWEAAALAATGGALALLLDDNVHGLLQAGTDLLS
jgi:hypothetical protein